jgi:long-chain acyl-CoA synthetase
LRHRGADAGRRGGAIAAAIRRANATLPDYAQVAQWLVSTPFTAANGLATGNGRPRRPEILHHHAAALAALYHAEVPEHVVL